jgi:hypothetical protein
MQRLEYEARFDAAIDALLAELAGDPWNLDALKELRSIALRQKAFGVADRRLWVRKTGDSAELIAWYREMAWQPLSDRPLIEIGRLCISVEATLSESQVHQAKRIRDWVYSVLRERS